MSENLGLRGFDEKQEYLSKAGNSSDLTKMSLERNLRTSTG